ncbi:putative secreted protein of unknown function with phospholipase C/P1 nuclease family domain [Chthoniobacter flavus Ellin428]|uniref:S1/P1 nuclease n=1 Tax=Chthoniobacter flavus Ellin428 TaxID=497964 RepID=B4CYG7_9BACT|nr:S1/P1 nuclease [Chthoniobacter flavus]EDY20508.1 putative secreted protein of unknown function with phospholipase C/P1 nuclease family domain [Chthoniobacter flavus Ellin428]TCO85552.1 S1/P1 nuclease [Chthoniobacter flavus]
MRSPFLHATILLLICASFALAWDTPGHEQIADMAYTRLTPAAKNKIREILQHGDPRYVPANNGDDTLRDAFRRASSFPDVIRDPGASTVFDDAYVDRMNLTFQPDVSPQQLAKPKSEYIRCKTWHYYDTPIHYSTSHAPKIYESNALVAYNYATAQLAKLKNSAAGADLRDAAWWLCWIEHLTGDLHQPLHCTSNYAHNHRGDIGGNAVNIIAPWDGASGALHAVNLHSYWDEGIDHAAGGHRSARQDLTPADAMEVTDAWLRNNQLKPGDSDAADLNVAHWIAQGAALADAHVYQETNAAGQTQEIIDGTNVTPQYTTDQIDVCEHQAVRAAYRLAAVLNGIFQP